MKYKIALLDKSTIGNFFELKKPSFECNWKIYESTTKNQITARIKDLDIVIVNKVKLKKQNLEQAHKLKMIALVATGYNNIDLDYCCQKNIKICNIRDYAYDSVPEHTFALILALNKNLIGYHRAVQDGVWEEDGKFCFFLEPIQCLKGSRLGIIGSGNLGKAVSKMGEAFGMDVKFALRKGETKTKEKSSFITFDELLSSSQIISIHCPLLAETTNLIGWRELKKMSKNCILINTSRGGIINEQDLVRAIKEKEIAAAGIDVVSKEPPNFEHPYYSILDYSNFILTPHTAWIGVAAIKRAWEQVIENITNFKNNKPIRLIT